MIRYTLRCAKGHNFESWFQSAAAFDVLQASGHVSCSLCGESSVTKALMAPAVTQGQDRPALGQPQSEVEAAMAALRRQVEENSEYVGLGFAAEARAMHDGDAPTRAIYGEARPDEARKLLEDGVPVAPLPFIPNRKTN
ncbi:DUF1178 family protein [Fuscibacter oryzae]|uniref:DUF1178 family protein n=1 Tax=Fuscibacter oryzae TaxID=2803939 RepID=A0A8J7MP56_9RHOB|nr:DUF1178 family protein [Fuscibacter oryzae]MBL4927416.1 DUF1178 family protein [Fuscibacter oryzae]